MEVPVTTSTSSTLNSSADSSAAGISTDTSSASAAGGGASSGWGNIFKAEKAGNDTSSESADVANGAGTETEENGAVAEGADPNAEKPEPWHKDPRFQEFLKEKSLLDQVKPMLEPLLAQYGGIEGIQAAVAEQERQAAIDQQKAIEAADKQTIEQRLQKQLQTGDLTEDAYDQALKYEVAMARIFRTEMDTAVNEAAKQFPHMDRDLVQAFASDPQTAKVIAQHTHGRIAAIEQKHAAEMKTAGERAVAAYVASQKERAKVPPAEGGDGVAPSGPIDRKNLGTWGGILAPKRRA